MKKWIQGILAAVGVGIIFVLYSFSSFLPFLWNAPSLLQTGNTYLITLHNESELRPTLGFLTAFILLEHTEDGWEMEFHDSYDIAPPPNPITAPDIIEEKFSGDSRYQGWVFRDSNFSPYFSENAKTAITFLQYDKRYKDRDITAVLSFDTHAIEKVIDTLGGVKYGERIITGKDLFSFLEADAKQFERGSEETWLGRKNEIQPLANALIKESLLSPLTWRSLHNTAQDLIAEKHILAYSPQEKIHEILSDMDMTGAIEISPSAVAWGTNIANMGGKKGDRYMQKSIHSTFSLDVSGNITERLRLHFDHEGTRNLQSDRYFGYIRIMRPEGTKVKKYTGDFMDEPRSADQIFPYSETFDMFFWVDESNSSVLEIEMVYPSNIAIQEDSPVFIQPISQAGIIDMPVYFSLQGFADETTEIQGCEDLKQRENISMCNFSLLSEPLLTLSKEKDIHLPIFEEVIYFDEGKRIRIQFSEELTPLQKENVYISRADGTRLEILSLENDTRAIVMELKEPLPSSPRQFYSIEIQNLSDLSQNTFPLYTTSIAYPKYNIQ